MFPLWQFLVQDRSSQVAAWVPSAQQENNPVIALTYSSCPPPHIASGIAVKTLINLPMRGFNEVVKAQITDDTATMNLSPLPEPSYDRYYVEIESDN